MDILIFRMWGQAFAIEREFINKRTGKVSNKELVYGITSRKSEEADAKRILKIVRGHWSIENSCHYIAQKMRELSFRARVVFDYLKMTKKFR